MLVSTPISVGELLDKITILEIKKERIHDQAKLLHINKELEALLDIVEEQGLNKTPKLTQALKEVNEALWEIEDNIRLCEKAQDFSERFIELARSVYVTNDKRAEIKRKINDATGSDFFEVKSYEDYLL